MPRPTIHCPHCSRELYHLHTPHCSWCGADLPNEEYQKVALPFGVPLTPDLPPLLPDNAWVQSPASRAWKLLNQNPAFGAKLILSLIAVLMLVVRVVLIPVAYSFQKMWHTHHLLPLH